jgi:hypothetical protein
MPFEVNGCQFLFDDNLDGIVALAGLSHCVEWLHSSIAHPEGRLVTVSR